MLDVLILFIFLSQNSFKSNEIDYSI